MDDDTARPQGTITGFVSGNETNFCYADDDEIFSEEETAVTSSGW